MSHSKPSATVNQKNRVLIICLHPGIRREFQDYLTALLGEYISFHRSGTIPASCLPAAVPGKHFPFRYRKT